MKGPRGRSSSAFVHPARLFSRSRFSQKKLVGNSGTEGAPRGDGPSLKFWPAQLMAAALNSQPRTRMRPRQRRLGSGRSLHLVLDTSRKNTLSLLGLF